MKNNFILALTLLLIPFFNLSSAIDEDSVAHECSSLLQISLDDLAIEKFEAGVSNKVYLLSAPDGRKFVAKIFTKQTLKEVQEIERISTELRQKGFQIPSTLYITQLEDKYPLVVIKFLEGNHAKDKDLPKIAELMAALHLESLDLPASERFKNDEHYQKLFEKCRNWTHIEELETIYKNLDLSYLKALPKGIIHGDFSYTNVLYNKDGLTLLDFEHVCTSYLLTDLVRAQMFFGFDSQGNLLEEKVKSFTRFYSCKRPLHQVEIDNFYTHMILMMLDTALEMYYHLEEIKDRSYDHIANENNHALLPELLVTKIKNLVGKTSIDLYKSYAFTKPPIIFFGLSGVGKTTLIHGLMSNSPDLFFIPVFTLTRKPRADDDLRYFSFVTEDEFIKMDQNGDFVLIMHEGSRYYGYKKTDLGDVERYPLLNCSVHALPNAKKLPGVCVLIEGNAESGLLSRNQGNDFNARMAINKRNSDLFFDQTFFRTQMDIIHLNEWYFPEKSLRQLHQSIFERLNEFDSPIFLPRAA